MPGPYGFAVSALVPTRVRPPSVEKSLDAARMSACATALQLRAAPGAVRPAGLAGTVALRTRRQQAGAANGAKGVALFRQ